MTPNAAIRLADLEEFELEIEKLVAGGDGLGRVEGIPIFVARSAPGDRVRIRLTERRPDYGRGEILEILRPGPGRREPPCPYFVRCGGCDLQHIDEATQLRAKAQAAVETLERLGGIKAPGQLEIVGGAAWAYRMRAQWHLESAGDGGPLRVGYFARGSHDLVAVDRCPILVPELEALLPAVPLAWAGSPSPPRRLDVAAGSDGSVTAAPPIEGLPRGEVTVRAAGLDFTVDARTFFQGHRGLVDDLVDRVVGAFVGEQAFDLYCGVGLFSLPLAQRYRQVLGIESNVAAVRFARANARRNHLEEKAQFQSSSVDGWIRTLPRDADRVVVDPPRTGLGILVRRLLADRAPRRLTYVSCHPATLARDLREFSASYDLESLHLIDLFPQTGHLEIVAQLALR